MSNRKALVLSSGGVDSTTAIGVAINELGAENENWSVVDGASRYIVSDIGNVIRLAYDVPRISKNGKHYSNHYEAKLLKKSLDQDGYPIVGIHYDNGVQKIVHVHRLVAQAFLLNDDCKPTVNHIDGNKQNNGVWNLEWATWKENNNHAINTGLRKSIVPIKCLDNGEIYPSIADAGLNTGVNSETIRQSIVGKYRVEEGFTFIKLDGSIEDEESYLKNSIKESINRKYSKPVSITCLDTNKMYATIADAAKDINVDTGAIDYAIKNKTCCKGHVFVRTSNKQYDKQRYMNYCYLRSKFYKHLATYKVNSLYDKAIVLSSGGLDSTTALSKAIEELGAENVVTVSVYYNQLHKVELDHAKHVADYYKVKHYELDLSNIYRFSNCPLISGSTEEIEDMSYAEQMAEHGTGKVSSYVPFRNGLLLSAVAALAQSIYPDDQVGIYIGAHADDAAGDAYADCSWKFVNAIDEAINIGTYGKVSIEAPFVNLNKAGVVKEGLRLKTPYSMTWSCYHGGEKPCGKCGTCIDRAAAFAANGVEDPALTKED